MLLLVACSVDLSDSTPVPPTAAGVTATTAAPTHTPRPSPTAQTDSAVPVTWGDLHLSGQIVFIMSKQKARAQGQVLAKLDLATGELKTLFEPPRNTWIVGLAVSPDNKQVLLAYAPPPPEGKAQYGYAGLYLMPLDGSTPPQALIDHTQNSEAHYNPSWSPDGKLIYYGHFVFKEQDVYTDSYTIERFAYPSGEPEKLVVGSFWPRLSADGQQMAFVEYDPTNAANALYLSDALGQGVRDIALPEGTLVDAPLFSPDSKWIIFSAASSFGPPTVTPTPAPFAWLASWFEPITAAAHNVPSDWWRVPVAGGQAEQITEIYDTGLYGDFSPDGKRMAFVGFTGLYVMDADGKNLTIILPDVRAYGAMDWIP